MDNRLEAIALEGWKSLNETKAFLNNLELKRQELLKQAEDLAMTIGAEERLIRHLLVQANTYKKIIDYANNDPTSIRRS